ncbi:MAG: sulfatase [Candidatus Hydrogenedentes bacterium]|nr:sulfatase [Candidatus Hydrogenedentota bacterium]
MRVSYLLAILSVILGLVSCDSGSTAGPPNVLFVVVDTLRADAVLKSRENVPVMPKLTAFARESVYFTNAVTPSSWTRPAMASVFTSLDVDVHGVIFSSRRDGDTTTTDLLPASLRTIATELKEKGYKTFGVQTNGNLSADIGFNRDFDSYFYSVDAPANTITDAALNAIKDATSPYFLYVHYIDPHAPYNPPKQYESVFGGRSPLSEGDKKAADDSLEYLKDKVYDVLRIQDVRKFSAISPQGREELKRRYDEDCRFTDDELARLLASIKKSHPNTIIVIMSDHGEEFWEHGSMGHGTTMYAEQVDVPLMFNAPGLSPAVNAETVSTLDVVPTIFKLLGYSPSPNWQGRDLFDPNRKLSEEFAFGRSQGPDSRFGVDCEMVQQGKWKLVHDLKHGITELFDTELDPEEKQNRIGAEPDIAKKLGAALDERNALNSQHPLRQRTNSAPVDNELMQDLKAIGYN